MRNTRWFPLVHHKKQSRIMQHKTQNLQIQCKRRFTRIQCGKRIRLLYRRQTLLLFSMKGQHRETMRGQEDHEGAAQEEESQPTEPERRSDSLASAFSDQDHFDAAPSLSPEGDGTAPPQTPPGGLPAEMTFAVKYRHGRIWRSWVPCFVVVNQQSVTKYPNEKRKEQKKKVIVLYDATISVGADVGSDE